MIKRQLSGHLTRLAKQYPVVTMTGPRQSGKTTLCQEVFPNYSYINLEDLSLRQFALADPRSFLNQYRQGVILDEIQRAPDLTSYIQIIVDETKKPGLFILTGSQQFEVTHSINQSLAGRTALLKLLPLSYTELPAPEQFTLSQLIYTGFYPRIYAEQLNPTEALSFYLSTYVERDIRALVNIKDLATFERFVKICATQIGQLLNYSNLANDCGITQRTAKEWLSLLEASYIIYQLQPHFTNFRKRLTKSRKLYFYDVGLACYLLGITQADYLTTHPLRGALFENFIVTEFLKNRFNQVKTNNLYFFRDHVGNEVDLILDYGQSLISVEIKAGETVSSDYFKGLFYYKSLSGQKNTQRFIVYAGRKSYVQQDVHIFSFRDLDKLFALLPK